MPQKKRFRDSPKVEPRYPQDGPELLTRRNMLVALAGVSAGALLTLASCDAMETMDGLPPMPDRGLPDAGDGGPDSTPDGSDGGPPMPDADPDATPEPDAGGPAMDCCAPD